MKSAESNVANIPHRKERKMADLKGKGDVGLVFLVSI
jgi:hypothetical protein